MQDSVGVFRREAEGTEELLDIFHFGGLNPAVCEHRVNC